MDRYNGTPVLLGGRLAYLPNEDDISYMKPEAVAYANTDALMPLRDDIITIDGIDGEWLVENAGQSAKTFNFCICHLQKIVGRTQITLGEYMQLRIAYDEAALNSEFRDCSNRRQVLWDAVTIVGQVQRISLLVRVPVLPKGVGLLASD